MDEMDYVLEREEDDDTFGFDLLAYLLVEPPLPDTEELIEIQEPEDVTWWAESDRSQEAIAAEYGIEWDGYATLDGVTYSPDDISIRSWKMWLDAEQYRLNTLI